MDVPPFLQPPPFESPGNVTVDADAQAYRLVMAAPVPAGGDSGGKPVPAWTDGWVLSGAAT